MFTLYLASAVFSFSVKLNSFAWMLLKLGTGNGERGTEFRESGNECTAVIPIRI